MLTLHPEVAAAVSAGRPVVALESALITHGLPRPVNVETVFAAEAVVRAEGAVPATIAVLNGRPTIGLTREEITALGQSRDVAKASRRDLAAVITQKKSAGTTVAATMCLALRAGIRVMATGGIGGVHRGAIDSFDVSADLIELARTPVVVVCAGAKSILDIPKTLEMLETLGVPIVGYGCDEFPAFFVRSSGRPVSARVNSPEAAARLVKAHIDLGGNGVVIAQPVTEPVELSAAELDTAMRQAEIQLGPVTGPAVTPALLAKLAEITRGKTLNANRELIVANARLAGQIARFV